MTDLFGQTADFFQQLQQQLCVELTQLETTEKKFIEDEWQSKLGQGRTNILEGGEVLEKAGVAFSSIAGEKLPSAASSRNLHLAGKPYKVCGISAVIHPCNPYAPTSHANFRIFVVDDGTDSKEGKNWWFGGGFDLTPYYIDKTDCDLWHKAAKTVCDKFDADLHSQLKQACDEYFYLPHRQEARGIGGIFFDDFNLWDEQRCLEFVQDAGHCYKDTYVAMVTRLQQKEFGEGEREFQLYRRGRYVEFNLLYDRGTLFGLQSEGRTESILMSLPPKVSWKYDAKFVEDSKEHQLQQMLQGED